ncbi:MAG: glycosyltransferase family 4 protein [Breznakibacter sp.]
MILLSHSGKQHSYQVANALNDLGHLHRFYTSSYLASPILQRYFTCKGNTYWTRRFIDGLPGNKVDANWRFEVPEVILRAIQGKSPAVQRAVYARDVKFDGYVARILRKSDTLARKQITHYWGFQGSCHQSLQAARQLGITTWCELATAHVVAAKRILGEESSLHPEWAHTIDNLTFPIGYETRLIEEPLLADKVVAASSFTITTLQEVGVADQQILYLPLGCDIDHVPYTPQIESKITQRPLRLLYAGTITQRKGIKYLLEAMKILNNRDIELHLIGGIQGNDSPLQGYKNHFHYHPPVSQSELFKLYGTYDALVLPTVFEGFGLVIVEAMAAGLPVITTPHSIGPELINDDMNGYIVPIRNVDALANAIEKLRNKTDEAYLQMRLNAREAALKYSWEAYRERLKRVLEEQL